MTILTKALSAIGLWPAPVRAPDEIAEYATDLKRANEARDNWRDSSKEWEAKFKNATEAEAEKAIAVLKRAIEAAENGNQAGENFVVGAASWNARPVYDEAGAEAEHEREMEAHSRVYGLRVGHTLTQVDYDAIQLYDKVSRRDQERALDAHRAGYKAGLRDGGSADIEKMDERLSNMIVEKGVESMMRTLAEQRGDEILAALIGVMDILARAESNASGNPEWDHVGPRVAAARAVVERFAAKQDTPS